MRKMLMHTTRLSTRQEGQVYPKAGMPCQEEQPEAAAHFLMVSAEIYEGKIRSKGRTKEKFVQSGGLQFAFLTHANGTMSNDAKLRDT